MSTNVNSITVEYDATNKYIPGDVFQDFFKTYRNTCIEVNKSVTGNGMSSHYILQSRYNKMWIVLPNKNSVDDKKRFIETNFSKFKKKFRYLCIHSESIDKRDDIKNLLDYNLIISTTDQFVTYFNSFRKDTQEYEEMMVKLKQFMIVGDEIHTVTNDSLFRSRILEFAEFVNQFKDEFVFHFFSATLTQNTILPKFLKVIFTPNQKIQRANLNEIHVYKDQKMLFSRAVHSLFYHRRRIVFFTTSTKKIENFVKIERAFREKISEFDVREPRYHLIAGNDIKTKTLHLFHNYTYNVEDANVIFITRAGFDSHSLHIKAADVFIYVELSDITSNERVMWYEFVQILGRIRETNNSNYFCTISNFVTNKNSKSDNIKTEIRKKYEEKIDKSKISKHFLYHLYRDKIINTLEKDYQDSIRHFNDIENFEMTTLNINGFRFNFFIEPGDLFGSSKNLTIQEKINNTLKNVADDDWEIVLDNIVRNLTYRNSKIILGTFSLNNLYLFMSAYLVKHFLYSSIEIDFVPNLSKSSKNYHELVFKAIVDRLLNDTAIDESEKCEEENPQSSDHYKDSIFDGLENVGFRRRLGDEVLNLFRANHQGAMSSKALILIHQLIELQRLMKNEELKYLKFKIVKNKKSDIYTEREYKRLLIVAKRKFLASAKNKENNEITGNDILRYIQQETKLLKKHIRDIIIMYWARFEEFYFQKNGSREFSALTSVNMTTLKASNMFNFLEVDISHFYPSCVDYLVGSNKASQIYDKIMRAQNCTRDEAKTQYNTMLNFWEGDDVMQRKIEFFRQYYTDIQADRIAVKSCKKGEVYNMFTTIEQRIIEKLKNELEDYAIYDCSYPQFFVRRHDSVIIFSSPSILKDIQEEIEEYFQNKFQFTDYVEFADAKRRVNHTFDIHSNLYLIEKR